MSEETVSDTSLKRSCPTFSAMDTDNTDQSIVSVKLNSINTAGGNKRRLKDLKTFVTAPQVNVLAMKALLSLTKVTNAVISLLYLILSSELCEVWPRRAMLSRRISFR
jgi:hypothetical protein